MPEKIVKHYLNTDVQPVESVYQLTHLTYVGQESPLHAGASAKILLANLNPNKLTDILDILDLETYRENTITSKEVLMAELRSIKVKGYAEIVGEGLKGA